MRTWTTREGKVIPIAEMSDDHLKNVLAFLRRRTLSLRLSATAKLYDGTSVVRGEMALDALEGEINYLEECSPDELLSAVIPAWDQLLAEAISRGLESAAHDESVFNSLPHGEYGSSG